MFFLCFLHGSHEGLLIFVSHKIAMAFIWSRATQAVALDISKAFNRYSEVLYKFKSFGILCQVLSIILSFLIIDTFMWFWMESHHNNIQLMLVLLSILGPAPFPAIGWSSSWYYYLEYFCSTLYSHCDQASDLRQHLWFWI